MAGQRGDLPAYQGLPWLKAVAVETDVFDLAQTAIRRINAGKHIHLDKPGGEIENPYPHDHELLVQEALLKASGCLID